MTQTNLTTRGLRTIALMTVLGLSACMSSGPTSMPSSAALPETVSDSTLFDLRNMMAASRTKVDTTLGFPKAVAMAVLADPETRAARQTIYAGGAGVSEVQAALKPQVSGRLYAGVQDATTGDTGAAATLTLSQMLYDGGETKALVSAAELRHQAAFQSYRAALNASALSATTAWIDLNRYAQLQNQIVRRLDVLNPLIAQLEQVFSAGVADATAIASAKRQINAIRVTEADIAQQYMGARDRFARIFGASPASTTYDASLIRSRAPRSISEDAVLRAPETLAAYLELQAAKSDLVALKARGGFDVGVEAQVVEPADGNAADRDASIGLVFRKTFYDGNRLKSQIAGAEMNVARQTDLITASYDRAIEQGRRNLQAVKTLRRSAELAREDAEIAGQEVELLRQQLSIGQSALEQVLAAEARLFSAQAQQINFNADSDLAQVALLANLGQLADVIGVDAAAQAMLGLSPDE